MTEERPRYVSREKDPEGYRAYHRAYQRARDKNKSQAHFPDRKIDRSVAAFDPRRDGRPIFRSASAELLGEPPIGRSALDQRRPSDARQ